MTKQKYPHFDPSKHNVDVKMAKVRVSSHCKHNINYHIVLYHSQKLSYLLAIPKFRKAVLVGEKLKEILSTIIKGQTEDMKCELLALEIMPDHIHIFIGARPTSTPSKIVNQIKGNTSRQIRLIFNDIIKILDIDVDYIIK